MLYRGVCIGVRVGVDSRGMHTGVCVSVRLGVYVYCRMCVLGYVSECGLGVCVLGSVCESVCVGSVSGCLSPDPSPADGQLGAWAAGVTGVWANQK